MNHIEKFKEKIDSMSYTDMLSRWRFAAVGDPMFQGEVGEYFAAKMAEKRDLCADPVAVSKAIGWEVSS